MPKNGRERVEPTGDWSQIQLLAPFPEQRAYELLRPVVLFGRSPPARPYAVPIGVPVATGLKEALSRSVSWTQARHKLIIGLMQSEQELHQRAHRKRQIKERLRTATLRSRDAQQQRTWAILSAHRDDLSIREIAKTAGLSPSRVHQILNSPSVHEIPVWLSQLREQGWPSEQKASTEQSVESTIGDLLTAEVEALRRCIGWLEQAEREESVVVNLRPDTETETEFVMFDRPRVLRVLERIAADLDELAHSHSGATTVIETSDEDSRARHRRRLAEPPSQPRRLSQREERAALRAAAGLPPE